MYASIGRNVPAGAHDCTGQNAEMVVLPPADVPLKMQRRLAAIIAADVVGYTRLMEQDEAGTFNRLRAHCQELFEPTISEHHGRVFKLMGDGLLAEFLSVVDAVECAVVLQTALAGRNLGLGEGQRIDLRMGINLGDVIIEGEDRYGESVNIAARLQALAEPGGITVSRTVAEHVKYRLGVRFEPLGKHQIKNIAEPLHVFRIRMDGLAVLEEPRVAVETTAPPLPLPDKPSIAALPFINLSGDETQDYFADGIVEDIIAALSRIGWLFVAARNSSFTYKGRAVDVKQVGRELGVRYVLEGSVRKAGNRVRIMGQLIDATTGMSLWADRFVGTLDNLFDLQEEVAASVVGAISPRLERAEIERSKQKPTESLDAYDFYLRAMANLHFGTREGVDEALRLLTQAIDRDPGYGPAHAMAAWCHDWRKVNGWMVDRAAEMAEGTRLARRTVELDRDDAVALTRAGHALAHLAHDLDGGMALLDRAKMLNPNLASAWFLGGFLRVWYGDPDDAVAHFTQAMRLSPLDPEMYRMQAGMAVAHLFAGRFDEASSWATKAYRDLPIFLMVVAIAAASHALAGRDDEAKRAGEHLRTLDPGLRISNLRDYLPIRRPQDLAVFADGLRRAGLPA